MYTVTGLNNKITIDGILIADWTVFCLDFGKEFLARLDILYLSFNLCCNE